MLFIMLHRYIVSKCWNAKKKKKKKKKGDVIAFVLYQGKINLTPNVLDLQASHQKQKKSQRLHFYQIKERKKKKKSWKII